MARLVIAESREKISIRSLNVSVVVVTDVQATLNK